MYTLKSIARRGTNLTAAIALAVSAVVPAVVPAGQAFADSLNPLTKRSLTLSSSSPGWSHTDGSGNSTYAPPNSGANGQKTGNTFSFDVSSDSTSNKIRTMTFQYCTKSAGDCTAPGDDATHGTDTSTTSDLNVHLDSTVKPYEVGDTTNGVTGSFSNFVDSSTGNVTSIPAANSSQGAYVVYYYNTTNSDWEPSTGWKISAQNLETPAPVTSQNNYIILTNTDGLGIPAGTSVKVVFFGTDDNYITNPGSGAFFVKINTYNKEFGDGTNGTVTTTGLEPATDANVIDGGVTVANVMNQSIQITTKVLETMQFSVGTVDPYTLDTTDGATGTQSTYEKGENKFPTGTPADTHATYGTCDPILTQLVYDPLKPQNVLQIGDQTAESSLSDQHTYSTHSYWRLSSNSSAGATVYYSGHTLTNTEGDAIAPIGAVTPGDGVKAAPHAGTEQFGLALDNTDGIDHSGTGGNDNSNAPVDYSQEATYENGADNGLTTVLSDAILGPGGSAENDSYHSPRLAPLVAKPNYNGGTGTVDGTPTTEFAFDKNSDTIPVALATENSAVVDCVTAKMRYIANIAATTPAGIYTTKVNYIAAPQY